MGQALVNQARFAVLAMWRRSLTHAAATTVMSDVRLLANYPTPRHTLSQCVSAKATRSISQRSSRLSAGVETARALSGEGLWVCADFEPSPKVGFGACLRSRFPLTVARGVARLCFREVYGGFVKHSKTANNGP